MGLDLRWPIGIMFTLIGVMLSISGLLAKPESYERSLNININLIWGLVLLVFGVFMVVMAIAAKKKNGEPPKS
jgi:multisubunit Na+/H+ antiporter MnhG subunit